MKMPFRSKKLPVSFKPIFWSYNFPLINTEKNKRTIIINVINYGNWDHWNWIIKYYGKEQIRDIIIEIPASEFRKPALKLISILLDIKELKYASRSDYITSQNNLRTAKSIS